MQVRTEMAPSRDHEAILKKRAKALRYTDQEDRFEILAVRARMTSEHGIRDVSLVDGKWSCTCEFFETHDLCSHTLALEMILREQAHLRLAAPDGE